MNKNKEIEIISKISELAHISTPELTAVLYGFKPTMADMINFDDFNSFKKKLNQANKLCKELSLKLAVSNYKFIINSPRGIFEMVEMNDKRKGKIAIGISKDMNLALEGVNLYYKKTLDDKASRRFGKIMGYPDCCLDFGDYLSLNSKGDLKEDPNNFGFANPAIESLKRSKDFAWQLNVFSESMLSYYSCSLTCKPSIKYVDNILAIFKEVDPKRLEWTESVMKEPASLYWTCADRILLYGDFKGDLKNSEIRYNKIISKITSDEFYQSNSSKFLNNLKNIAKEIQKGNRLIMTPQYFEIYKDKKRILKVEKENQYIPVLVKPNK